MMASRWKPYCFQGTPADCYFALWRDHQVIYTGNHSNLPGVYAPRDSLIADSRARGYSTLLGLSFQKLGKEILQRLRFLLGIPEIQLECVL